MEIVTRSADDCYFEDKQATRQCKLKQLEAVMGGKAAVQGPWEFVLGQGERIKPLMSLIHP